MSYLGYDINKDVTQPQINPIGALQAGQNFSEGLLKQKQAQKLANAQDQYANAPDYATQQGALRQLSAYSPAMSESIRVNQASAKAQRDEFLARGANDILQAPPEQQAAMHDQLVQQGIQNGFLPPETAQHIGKFDQSDIQEMQNLVRKAQPMSAISPAAQQSARIQQMKEMAELGKLQAETNKTNLESKAVYGNSELPLKGAGQLGAPLQMPQQGALTLPAQPTDNSVNTGSLAPLGAKPSGAEQAADQGQQTQTTIQPTKPIEINGIQESPNPLDQFDTSSYSPRVVNMAKALIDGRQPFPTGMSMKNPLIGAALNLAQQADPSLDAMTANIRHDARKDITTGKSAQSIKALNTAIGHLGRLSDNFDALNNSGIAQWVNTAENAVMQTNNPKLQTAMTKVSTDATAVSHELATVFRNQGMSEGEIKDWQSKINTSNTPAQNKAVVDEALALMNTRLESIKDQYEKGMRVKIDNPVQLLNKESQKVYNKLTGNPETSETTPKESAQVASEPSGQNETPAMADQRIRRQSATKQIANLAQHQELASGTTYTDPEGNIRRKR